MQRLGISAAASFPWRREQPQLTAVGYDFLCAGVDIAVSAGEAAMNRIERVLESTIVHSRWLPAPFYLGLIVSLVLLLFHFVTQLAEFVLHIDAKDRRHSWGAQPHRRHVHRQPHRHRHLLGL
jgi:hypothetical protein